MPWNSIGAVIVGTSWQFSSPYPAQAQNTIRITPGTGNFPAFPCILALRRENGLWHYGTRGIFIERDIPLVEWFDPLPTGLISSNFQVGLKLSRQYTRQVGVSVAYWTN